MIGLEATFEEHLANLVAVFREVRRVLRKDGTCWLNYGDAYASNGKPGGFAIGSAGVTEDGNRSETRDAAGVVRKAEGIGLKPKDLMLMPARVALALQADGWWVRSEIVWHKPNPMPESVRDRPTSAHEKVFLLSKSPRYFYDAEAVRTALLDPTDDRKSRASDHHKSMPDHERNGIRPTHRGRTGQARSGANLRNVWKIPTQGYSEAHFATFTTKLVVPCIKAGTSEKGVCSECGSPWGRVLDKPINDGHMRSGTDLNRGRFMEGGEANFTKHQFPKTTGWKPTCDCNAPTKPAVVLDPFAGAGTVGLVAQRLGRDAILCEISPEYAGMARRRIHDDAPLFSGVQLEGQ